MGRTAVEIILFRNETIKFNENLDRDVMKKFKKVSGEIQNTAREKKG